MLLSMINEELYLTTIEEYITATFSPETKHEPIIELKVSGKTYKERKADLEDKAKEYQRALCEYSGLSMMEYSIIEDFFEKNGKRYGLITDFRMNCIC